MVLLSIKTYLQRIINQKKQQSRIELLEMKTGLLEAET
jgi:hypothetical protein